MLKAAECHTSGCEWTPEEGEGNLYWVSIPRLQSVVAAGFAFDAFSPRRAAPCGDSCCLLQGEFLQGWLSWWVDLVEWGDTRRPPGVCLWGDFGRDWMQDVTWSMLECTNKFAIWTHWWAMLKRWMVGHGGRKLVAQGAAEGVSCLSLFLSVNVLRPPPSLLRSALVSTMLRCTEGPRDRAK